MAISCFKCTTDPGSAYMDNPILENTGCAILKPNQYRGSHKLRLHGGKYLALGQKKDVTVYRDNDRDDKYDLDESKQTQVYLELTFIEQLLEKVVNLLE
jgi:hypothetical protein